MLATFHVFPDDATCCTLKCGERTFTIDSSDRIRLIKRKYLFESAEDKYPVLHDDKSTNLFDILFNNRRDNVVFEFKNGDETDLRKANIAKYHNAHLLIKDKYEILEYIPGHFATMGTDAYKAKNPLWRVKDENGCEFILMYCERDTIIKLCEDSHRIILEKERDSNDGKKITWFIQPNGYAFSSSLGLYMHQVIMKYHGNGKGTNYLSVDHVNRNKTDNTMANLRIATWEEQSKNSSGIIHGTKRKRRSDAAALPEGLKQTDMPKYVVFYNEGENRCFFKVERHPNQKRAGENGAESDEVWVSSKSCKVSIKDKLAAAVKVVNDLDENIQPVKVSRVLPKYVSLMTMREKEHLVFEKRDVAGKRLNLKMILPESYNLDQEIDNLKRKVLAKYPDFTFA